MRPPRVVGLIHASIEIGPVNCNDGESGTSTNEFVPPLIAQPLPISPGTNVTPPAPALTPLFEPTASLKSPSARHQLTIPLGRGTHGGAPSLASTGGGAPST